MRKLITISCLLLSIAWPAAAETDLSPLLGTWVNPEYNPTRHAPKFTYKPDGTVALMVSPGPDQPGRNNL